MKRIIFCLLIVALFSCPAFADTPEYIDGEVLVVMNAPMSAFSTKEAGANAFSEAVLQQAQDFADEFGLEALNAFPEIARISGKSIIHLSSEYQSTEELISELSEVSYIEGVYPNGIMRLDATASPETLRSYSSETGVPNDPSYSQQWGMKAMEMETVWDNVTGSDTVCVAIFDTGIDYNHPDISANMARDSSGYFGRYIKNGITTNDPMDKSARSHGTHVAGIIGAVGNNSIGVTGVNWRVKMLAVNVMPDESATESDTISGIEYVLEEKSKGLNIRVANISFGLWGTYLDTSALGRAIKSLSDAGIICVMAAGNDSLNISNPGRSGRVYPACFRFDNTISVGSTSYGNGKASHSNYSSEWVDVGAPGDQIYSTILNSGYGTLTGTSMATPHVAGAAAILSAARPNETPTQIKTRILNGTKKLGINEGFWRSGVIDVAGAYFDSGVNVPVTGVSLNKNTMELGVGEGETLFAIITPSNATNRNTTWRSSNTAVATVTGGYVVAVNVGSATITVETVDGNRTATCNVNVTPAGSIVYPTRVTIDKATLTIPLGGSAVLTATVEPSNTTNKNVEWFTNNPFTATVAGGVVTAGQYPGQATITVRSVVDTRLSKTCDVTVTSPATGITLDKTQTIIEVGDIELLLATVSPPNVTNPRVVWSSNNDAVATVTQGGLIRGISPGIAVITAETEDGGFKASCSVTVGGGGGGINVPAAGVTLNKSNATLSIGASEMLTATVAPSDATNKNVTWVSGNEAVATVVNGLVTGVSAGTATITVRTVDGNFQDSCTVVVIDNGGGTNVPVIGVELNKTTMNIGLGGSEILTAMIKPENATNQNVIWSSSNNAVATVVSGLVTGVGVGTATITVITVDGYISASCMVTVTDGGGGNVAVTGVALSQMNMSINIGNSVALTHTIFPSNASNQNVTWTSSNNAVATVVNGLVTGVSFGTATITVITIDGNFPASCAVTVSDIGGGNVAVTGVELNRTSSVINIGGTNTIIAKVLPENATNTNVTWISGNPAVATVNNGVITGVSLGSTTVTVRTVEGGFESICTVSVTDQYIPVTGIALHDERTLVIKVGEQAQLNATVIPANATIDAINWDSSAMSVASVTQYGLVRGLEFGNAVIYATAADSANGDFTVSCDVTVLPADPLPEDDIIWVDHQNSSNVEYVAGKMPDFEASDLEKVNENVTVKRSIAEDIFKENYMEKIGEAKGFKVETLPWFEATVDIGQIAAVRIPVSGSQIYYDYAKDILLLKIITPSSGDLLSYATTSSEFDDGRFTFMEKESDTPYLGFINVNTDYDIVVFIKDGGIYDLDKEMNGSVVDPIVQIRRTFSGQDDDEGGCSTGFGGGISSLLVALAFFTHRRKR